jgi:probable F420-dependent oxidoreductase
MRIGITAFLTDLSMPPGALAHAVEERGFYSLYLPEHTHLPVRESDPPSLVEGVTTEDYRRSLDPFVALAAASQTTSRIRLGTGVSLVALHDPIVLAKQVATLDLLSGGRVDLGVGFGWNRSEAEDHGVDFSSRREIAEEKIQCLRAIWSEDQASFEGRYVHLEPSWSWPKPVQTQGPPVLVGGGATDRTFALIARCAEGWMPIGGRGIAAALPNLRRHLEAAGRDVSSVRVVPFGTIPSTEKLAHFASSGIEEVVLRVRSGPAITMLEQLDEHATYLDLSF